MSGRLRVLHVIQNLNYGGMERLLADIVRLLPRERFEPHVLMLEYVGRFGEGLEQYGGVHLVVPRRRVSMVWPRVIAAKMRTIAPDVVHSHSGVWYKSALAARLAGVARLVHTEHGRLLPDPWSSRLLDGLAAQMTDVVVAVSDVLAAYLAEHIVADRHKIETVVNGVDTARYRPCPDDGALRRELGIGPGTPILGSIGRLEHIKGYDIMVEAYARLRATWSGLGEVPVLVLAGDGRERTSLAARAREAGVADGVFLLGWRDDIERLHASFACFTISSRSEGTSVSLLEAMSAGLCPVVTDIGGNAAVLGPELAHRLVRPRDPAALAAAWGAVLAEPARRTADGACARARVVERFELRRMVDAYARLYAGEAAA